MDTVPYLLDGPVEGGRHPPRTAAVIPFSFGYNSAT